jgi:predicted dehydrogenase
MLRAAIVGLGWWGQELVRSATDSTCLRFTRGVTLEPEQAQAFADEHGLLLCTSYEEVLADAEIDAVVLATPHSLHRPQIEAAAAAQKHVYCEKPLALTYFDAKAAISACATAGVALGVGHNRRLWPSIKAIKDLCERNALGTIMHVEGNYSHDWLASCPPTNWRSAPEETRAGGMTGMGIHLLDCFSYLVGPISRLTALSTSRALALTAGDTTAAMLQFENGATGLLGTTLKTPYIWRLAIYGSDAWVESTGEEVIVLHRAGEEPKQAKLCTINHVRENLESFAAAARRMGLFHIDQQVMLHTIAALESVFLSASQQGAWQYINDVMGFKERLVA